MNTHSLRLNRRTVTLSGIALAATAMAAGASDGRPPIHQKERTISMNDEPNLSEDDPRLSQRARELIRIGRVSIANEDKAAAAAFFHPDFRFHGPDETVLTREQLWDYFAACRAAFDDFSVTRQQIFSDGGDFLAARTTFRGIFARPFSASPVGTLQPHGRPVYYRINNVFRYAADGKLIEEWAQYDSRLLLERLGVKMMAGL